MKPGSHGPVRLDLTRPPHAARDRPSRKRSLNARAGVSRDAAALPQVAQSACGVEAFASVHSQLNDGFDRTPRRVQVVPDVHWCLGAIMCVMEIENATRGDADAVAAMFGAARRAAMPWLPRLHSDAEDRRYFAGHVIGECDVTVLRRERRLVAFLALRNDMVEHLCVRPDARAGAGSAPAVGLPARRRRTRVLRAARDSPKSDSPTAQTTRS
jgi:hypothetical protein